MGGGGGVQAIVERCHQALGTDHKERHELWYHNATLLVTNVCPAYFCHPTVDVSPKQSRHSQTQQVLSL